MLVAPNRMAFIFISGSSFRMTENGFNIRDHRQDIILVGSGEFLPSLNKLQRFLHEDGITRMNGARYVF
jgi:hypothetical protein